jgi:Secretion system C-terminal sorting domain
MGTTVSICIFNTAGERIVDRRSQKLNSGANWMDLPALSSGMYAIQILNGDSAIGVKLMVE